MVLGLEKLKTRQYAEGVPIFEEGVDADEAFIIESGSVRIFTMQNNKEHDLAVLEAGAVFGEMAMIKQISHTCSAQALSRTTVAVIPRDELFTKMAASDPLIKGLLYMLVNRLYDGNERAQNKQA